MKPPDVGLLAAGGDNTCAVAQDGAPRRWGGNDVGQVGDGTTANRNVPTLVVGLT
ncbi:MAG: RCC1 domain-containing protein [Microthrixaceae bacterium]